MLTSNLITIICISLLGGALVSNQQEIPVSYQKSTPNDPYYIAGVVEFQQNLFDNVKDNFEGYKKIIESKDAETTDIIVFPEGTLNTMETAVYVPNPKDNVTLCNNIDDNTTTNDTEVSVTDLMKQLSCLAKKVQKYLLINLTEKENCTTESQIEKNDTRPCTNDGLTRYNTNVVFNRNGTLISRYRKWNLYAEDGKNTTMKPEYSTFTTDFGVTFGQFICFDILFYTPTQELVEMGITDFAYPTMWFSELPFLTAVQQQRAWAYGNDVNLLAAGASTPIVGSTGTGIYAGKKGGLIHVMASTPQRKIYVAKVPKKNFNSPSSSSLVNNDPPMEKSRLKGLKLLRDNVNNYNVTFLNSTDLKANETICSKSLCCKFHVEWSLAPSSSSPSDSLKSYQYVLAAYEGERTYQSHDSSYIRTCALIACTNHNINSCATLFPDDENIVDQFVFNEIQIEGNFNNFSTSENHNNNKSSKNIGKTLIMPSNLDEAILPLPVDEFNFEITPTKMTNGITSNIVKCQLKKPSKSNLLTFGIYANDFSTPSSDEKGSSSKINFSINTIITSLVLILVCKQFSN